MLASENDCSLSDHCGLRSMTLNAVDAADFVGEGLVAFVPHRRTRVSVGKLVSLLEVEAIGFRLSKRHRRRTCPSTSSYC